jgi:hypothetical protein
MNTEKKNRMRMVVREVIDGKVTSLINDDIFADNELRDRVFDSLPTDLVDDPEVEECLLRGEDGACVTEVIEAFIDTLTNAFMNRFNNE